MDQRNQRNLRGESENAAENTAFVFSLTESCRLNGINPETYFGKLVIEEQKLL